MTKAKARMEVTEVPPAKELPQTAPDLTDRGIELETPLITTSRTFVKGGKEFDSETTSESLQVRDFLVPPARVGVEFGHTINLGNYESLRIGVTVQVPCYAEEVEDAYDHVVAFAKNRLAKEREKAVEWARKKGVENLF